METGYINNIFLIKNSLEKFTSCIKKEGESFNFCETSLENLTEMVKRTRKKVQSSAKDLYAQENNLIIVDHEFYKIHTKRISDNIFLAGFLENSPHFLFITRETPEVMEKNLEFDNDDFFYNITSGEFIRGELKFSCFNFSLVFKCIANRKRIHSYIINSFQTIVESTIVAKQKVQIEKLYAELEAVSKTDVLTGVLSRRAFFEALELERSRTVRGYQRVQNYKAADDSIQDLTNHYGHFTCMMIDIDNFKRINDTYGHLVGDEVLKLVGAVFKNTGIFRENDIIGRYGGEEFAVILPETNEQNAGIPAMRLCQKVRELDFFSEKGTFHITVSIGIAEFSTEDKNIEEVLARADSALYHSKQTGKDKVSFFSITGTSSGRTAK